MGPTLVTGSAHNQSVSKGCTVEYTHAGRATCWALTHFIVVYDNSSLRA